MTITTRPLAHPYTARHNTHPSPGFHVARRREHRPRPQSGMATPSTARESRSLAPRQRYELFVDLTSPWAYLAHLRLGDRASELSWAVVQTPTAIPRTGLRGAGPDRDRLREELAAARAAAMDEAELPPDVPAVLPHPRTVAAAYAEADDLGVGAAAREALLRAYWVEGRDIGNPEVLRQIMPAVIVNEHTLCTGDPRLEWGYLVSPAREPLTNQAYHQLERWQQRWTNLGQPGPLALVDESGATRTGPAALTM